MSQPGAARPRIFFVKLLAVSAVVEALTGIALIIVLAVVVRLLFSGNLSLAGAATGRVAGFALFALGLACWPRKGIVTPTASFQALLAYNVLLALFLSYLGIGGALVGRLLWFAVAFHAAMAALLIRAWFLAERFDSIDRVGRRR